MNEEMFIEIMAHILTIEDMICSKYKIPYGLLNKQKNINKVKVEEQIKKNKEYNNDNSSTRPK